MSIKEFEAIIERNDGQEIESARDRVKPELLPELAAYYRTLDDWPRKLALVNLIQDHISPKTRFIMLDILHAPESSDNDDLMLTKAIALCHLDNDFDCFDTYYQDRRLLRDKIQAHLKQTPASKSPSKKPQLITIIATLALIIGPLVSLLGYQTEQALETFRREGVSANASVIGKRRAYRQLCIRMSYFDASVLKGGKLYRPESCDFVFGSIWHSLNKGDKAEILFLPQEPERFILKAALQPEHRPLIDNTRIGIALIFVGLLFLALRPIRAEH